MAYLPSLHWEVYKMQNLQCIASGILILLAILSPFIGVAYFIYNDIIARGL